MQLFTNPVTTIIIRMINKVLQQIEVSDIGL